MCFTKLLVENTLQKSIALLSGVNLLIWQPNPSELSCNFISCKSHRNDLPFNLILIKPLERHAGNSSIITRYHEINRTTYPTLEYFYNVMKLLKISFEMAGPQRNF